MSKSKGKTPATARVPPLPPCELQRRIAHYCNVKNARPLSYDEANICKILLHQLRPLLSSCLQNLKEEHARQKAAAVGSALQITKNNNEKIPTEAETTTDRNNPLAETLPPLPHAQSPAPPPLSTATRIETSVGSQSLNAQSLFDNTLPDMDEVLFGKRRLSHGNESARGRPEDERSHSVTPQKRGFGVEGDDGGRGSKRVAQGDKIFSVSPPPPLSTGSTHTSTNDRRKGRRSSTSSLARDSSPTPAAQSLMTTTSRLVKSRPSDPRLLLFKPLVTDDDYFESDKDEDETAAESTPIRCKSLVRVPAKSVSSPIPSSVTVRDRCETGWFKLLLDRLEREIKVRGTIDFVLPLEVMAMAVKGGRDDGRRRILIDVGPGSGVNKRIKDNSDCIGESAMRNGQGSSAKRIKDNLDGVGENATRIRQGLSAKSSESTTVKPLVKTKENDENLSSFQKQECEANKRDELMRTPVMKSRLVRRDAAEWASTKTLNNGSVSEKSGHETREIASSKRPSLLPKSHPTTTTDIVPSVADDYSDPLPPLTPTQPLTHPHPPSNMTHTSATFVPCSVSDVSTVDELSSDPPSPPFITEAWYDRRAITGSLSDASILCALSSDLPTADTLIMEQEQVGTEKEKDTMVNGEWSTGSEAHPDTDADRRDILPPLLLAQSSKVHIMPETMLEQSSGIGETSILETSSPGKERTSELRYTCLKHDGPVEAVACGRRGNERRWRIAVVVGQEVRVWERGGEEEDEWGVLGRWTMGDAEIEDRKIRAFFALNDDLLLVCHQSCVSTLGSSTALITIDLRKPSMAEPVVVLNEKGDANTREGMPIVLVETVENDVEEEGRVAIVGSWDGGSTVEMLEIGSSGRLLATKSTLPSFMETASSSLASSPLLCSICTVRNKSAFVLGSFDDGSLIIWDISTRTCLATLRPKPYTWSCVAAVAHVRQHGVALVLAVLVGSANWGVVPVLVGPGDRDLASVEVLKWGVGAVGAHNAIVTSDRYVYVTTPAGEIVVCEKGSGKRVRVLRDKVEVDPDEVVTEAILPARRCLDVDPCDRFLVAGWSNGCVDVCEG